MLAAHLLGRLLAARQEQAGILPRYRISAQILGDSGPIIQTGSRARVFGGLALLAAIAVGLAWDGAGRWGAGARSEPGSYVTMTGEVAVLGSHAPPARR